MKKFLLSTTIFAATAGIAAADITVSGDARMGIVNGLVFGAADDDTVFTSRARLIFTLSGATDTGLEFGASFRADSAIGAAAGTAGEVHISGAFGKLSMGDVDGAANAAVGHVDGVGLTGLGDLNEMVYIANGGLNLTGIVPTAINTAVTADPSALYEYSAGGLSLYASVSRPGFQFDSTAPLTGPVDAEGIAYALGAAYAFDAYRLSVGYEKLDISSLPGFPPANLDGDHWILGADASFGAVSVKARYGSADVAVNGTPAVDFDQWALSGTYRMDDLSVTAFASSKHTTTAATGANVLKNDAIGLGAAYDLGGGAMVKGGIVQLERTTGPLAPVKDTAFDLGVAFTF